MSTTQHCRECDMPVTAASPDGFGAAFVSHVRSQHPELAAFPEVAIENYGEALLRLTGARERLASIGAVTIEPVTDDRLDDWAAFFDHDGFADNPAWAACYCTEPHCVARGTAPEDIEHRPWRDRRQDMLDLLRAGRAEGYLAFVDGQAAGWVNASRRSECSLYRLGSGADPADDEVISVVCFVIAPPYRRHGLAAALLSRVIADAPDRKASWIEAYPPIDPRDDDSGNFRGPRSLYDQHGFDAVGTDHRHTVMRRRID
jgi:GNAT superfamily N-acetyltransferase